MGTEETLSCVHVQYRSYNQCYSYMNTVFTGPALKDRMFHSETSTPNTRRGRGTHV